VLNVDIPKLMEELPSERDTPATLRVKMGQENDIASVPIPTTGHKFGRSDESYNANPFGFDQNDEDRYW
jgi:hypothetical protein